MSVRALAFPLFALAAAGVLWLLFPDGVESGPGSDAIGPGPSLDEAGGGAAPSTTLVTGVGEGADRDAPGLVAGSDPPAGEPGQVPLLDDLEVQVVDPQGVPVAGIPVEVVALQTNAPWRLVEEVTRGEQAVARFGRLASALATRRRAGDRLAVGLGLPLDPPVRVDLDPFAPAEERVVLELPPTGPLTVRVETAEGATVNDRLVVSVGAVPANGSRASFQPQLQGPSVRGSATFARVGLGMRLLVRVDGVAGRGQVFAEGDGPRAAGVGAEIVVRLPGDPSFLIGRLLDSDGEALAGRSGSGRVLVDGEPEGGAAFRTDSGGGFRFEVTPPWRAGTRREVRISVLPLTGPPLDAWVDLSRTLAPGTTDLGELVASPRPVAVSGAVRGPGGEPVEGALVRVLVPADGPSGWRDVAELSATTDGEGRFAVHGAHGAPSLLVRVARAGYRVLDRSPVAPGETGLELVLEADPAGTGLPVRRR